MQMNSSHIHLTAESIANALGCGQSGCTCGRPNGDGWMTHCPAHDDEHPSFTHDEDMQEKIYAALMLLMTREDNPG